MTEDERTIWCGNLNEKVTEDVLYELFLQAGPLDRIHIPKDRDGKQRTFAFITYKHLASVRYAVSLFDGTLLFNRQINMKARSNEMQPETNSTEQNVYQQNELLHLGKQMLQCIPNPSLVYGNFPCPPMLMQSNQFVQPQFYYNEERRAQPNYGHPYQRESERPKSRYNNDHGHDNRRDNYSSSHRNNYRENPHYSQRHGGSRHESSGRQESNNRHESSSRHDRRYYRS